MEKKLQVVVETPEFIKRSSDCMDKQAKSEFINYIAKYPEAGDLISGTGGARKIRWQSEAEKGKQRKESVVVCVSYITTTTR